LLAAKGLLWRGHYIVILKGDQSSLDYMRINLKAVVPTLVNNGRVVTESTVIAEYLDEVFSNPPQKPAVVCDRHIMRLWTKAVDEEVHLACAELTFACTRRHTLARLPAAEHVCAF